MEIDDKGGEVVQRYDRYGGEDCKVEIRYESLKGWTWTWTKREQHWRKEKDQNSWTREAHKQGEQAHEL